MDKKRSVNDHSSGESPERGLEVEEWWRIVQWSKAEYPGQHYPRVGRATAPSRHPQQPPR